MKTFFLIITYFLIDGSPVLVEPIPAYHDNGRPVIEIMDCLEKRDNEIRRFFDNKEKSEGNVFFDISVECVKK